MVLTFFTAVHVRSLSKWVKKKRHSQLNQEQTMLELRGEWCVELQYIGMNYLRGFFVLDFVAFAPSLLGVVFGSPYLIMFRILRFSKLSRLLHKFDVLQSKIQTRYMRYQRNIYNVFLVVKAGFIISCLVHFTICFLILVSLSDVHGSE